ncbi:unnamed protein product [marine sediment metagenome]|uniref:PFL domain-containing protein n=1 Tax=marine sediment metagenome TaxID=412755 RepID=X0VPM7_9ZZZZ
MGLTPLEMTGEKSDPKVVKEIADLMFMMDNWKKGFRTWCEVGEDNEWVYNEFLEDITTHLQPYAHALTREGHINYYGGQCLMMFAFNKVEELRNEFK